MTINHARRDSRDKLTDLTSGDETYSSVRRNSMERGEALDTVSVTLWFDLAF